MRKVIGIGETILDIIFRDGVPTAAVPGGSTFNTIVSLGRMGVPATFVTDLGDDHVGRTIRAFMGENSIDDRCVSVYTGQQSPVSLAFLDADGNATYEFFREPFAEDHDWPRPEVDADDIVVFGSYYALSPVSRYKVKELMEMAREKGAIVMYDVNFRRSHQAEAIRLTGTLLENLEYADLVRGSIEDFEILWGLKESAAVYRGQTAFYCPRLLCSLGAGGVDLYTPVFSRHYDAIPLIPVSTIGAGDNFNAGIVYGLLQNHIRRSDLDSLTPSDWESIVRYALAFSANVCMSSENYVDRGFRP